MKEGPSTPDRNDSRDVRARGARKGPMFRQRGRVRNVINAALGLGSIGTMSAEATAQSVPQPMPAPRTMHTATAEPQLVTPPKLDARPMKAEDTKWLDQKLTTNEQVTVTELQRIESLIMNDRVPLSLQIRYLEGTLAIGGYYDTRLRSADITAPEISNVLALNSVVSARLTDAYERGSNEPELDRYFKLDKLKQAARTKTFKLLRSSEDVGPEKTKFCNGYVAQIRGDVYFITADHCVAGTVSEKDFRRAKSADHAIKFIPPEQYKEWHISDSARLPAFGSMITPESVSGHVVVSYNWRPTKDFKKLERKVFFSFATWLPAHAKAVRHDQDSEAGKVVIITPPTESKILRSHRDAKGNLIVDRVVASGSSGSEVAMDGGIDSNGVDRGYFAMAPLEYVQPSQSYDDVCRGICYTIEGVSNPNAINDLISEDQRERALGMVKELEGIISPRR